MDAEGVLLFAILLILLWGIIESDRLYQIFSKETGKKREALLLLRDTLIYAVIMAVVCMYIYHVS